MTVDQKLREYMLKSLDQCNAALQGKPELTVIYDEEWRSVTRDRLLKAKTCDDLALPLGYYAPCGVLCPADFQGRIEQGAAILRPKLSSGEWSHLVNRMRGNGCTSAEEELLLARGFAREFGRDAIVGPSAPPDQARPEFVVVVDDVQVDVEAKSLLDSERVTFLREEAISSGNMCWVSCDPAINCIARLRTGVTRKATSARAGVPTIIVLSQHSAWPSPDKGIELLCETRLSPASLAIPEDRYPLGVAYVFGFLIQGVVFNTKVVKKFDIPSESRERIRGAIQSSFWTRSDGRFE